MASLNKLDDDELRVFLNEKVVQYNRPNFIASDPICVPHLFSRKEDIELAGFFAATIAWGQRPTIIKNATYLMKLMDMAPFDFITNAHQHDMERFQPFNHRTLNGEDCIFLVQALQRVLNDHGSLEAAFCTGSTGARSAISNFRKRLFRGTDRSRTQKHVSDPEKGSACKRLNMFLRWMVRTDKAGVDLGIWKGLSPADLHCPLDVHSGSVARKLGLLTRKQNDWKAVDELTCDLRRLDPSDPAKYDFALFGLGVFERF